MNFTFASNLIGGCFGPGQSQSIFRGETWSYFANFWIIIYQFFFWLYLCVISIILNSFFFHFLFWYTMCLVWSTFIKQLFVLDAYFRLQKLPNYFHGKNFKVWSKKNMWKIRNQNFYSSLYPDKKLLIHSSIFLHSLLKEHRKL